MLTYVPLVKHIVYKKLRELPPSCEVDDLISCGIESLIRALERYDPGKGASLEPYYPEPAAQEPASSLPGPWASAPSSA